MAGLRGFKEQQGTSWKDVEDWLEDFETEHDARITITMSRKSWKGSEGYGLRLTATAASGDSYGSSGWQRTYSIDWPSYGTRTMAGAYVRLIHEFGEALRLRPPVPGKPQKVPTLPFG